MSREENLTDLSFHTMNRLNSASPYCALLALLLSAVQIHAQLETRLADEVSALCGGLPFAMPRLEIPRFPAARFDIRKFGAVPDGVTLNTRAFSLAIEACVSAGGGTIDVPAGTWLTGPIELQSNVCLHLDRGALLQMSDRIEDYPLVPRDGDSARGFIVASAISARDARNIAITGKGIIDGAGEVWRYVLREKQTEKEWRTLISGGGVVTADSTQWWPSKDALEGELYLKTLRMTKPNAGKADYEKARHFLRPDLVRFVRCDGILLDGPTFRNSPRYHLHPIQSENIVIRDVSVLTPWFAMNGDGIDLSACRRVVVFNSTLDVGDDGLCLKPSEPSPLQRPGPSCSEIVIADCTVYRAHGGFVIGSESYGGVKNVAVRNCIFIGTDVGIRLKSSRGRGGLVEGVWINGIQMRSIVNEAILFDMYYSGGAPEVESVKDRSNRQAMPVTSRTPRFQDFLVKNVVCNGASRAVLINGLPEVPIRNIEFDSVRVTSRRGISCIDAEGVRFNACSITAAEGPAITVNAGDDISISRGSYESQHGCTLRVEGRSSHAIRLNAVHVPGGAVSTELAEGVSPDAVLVDHASAPGAQ